MSTIAAACPTISERKEGFLSRLKRILVANRPDEHELALLKARLHALEEKHRCIVSEAIDSTQVELLRDHVQALQQALHESGFRRYDEYEELPDATFGG